MFDNILGQSKAIDRLKNDLDGNQLPGAILFEGPAFSAKLSTALELARVLACTEIAEWRCQCPHCERHRVLSHQDILLLGPKSHREELQLGLAMLEKSDSRASRYFFARAARKLTRRFDRVLFENEEKRFSKAAPFLRQIMEELDTIIPGNFDAALKAAKALLPVAFKLNDLLPDTIPVYQIRAMESWARQTGMGKRKTVIIEHAERMLESSRNALLKILEEPPAQTIFILTSINKTGIAETVSSRLRPYRFFERNSEETRDILKRVFRDEDAQAPNLKDYFNRYRSGSSIRFQELAREFASNLILEKTGQSCTPGSLEILWEAAKLSAGFGSQDDGMEWSFPAFLEEAGAVFIAGLREDDAALLNTRLANSYTRLANEALFHYRSFNLNPLALGERLVSSFIEERQN